MGKNSKNNYKPTVPDHNFLFTYTMLVIVLNNRMVTNAALDWFDNGCHGMKQKLRNEATDFMQEAIKRAFVIHCNQAIESKYPGMD